MGYEFSEEFFVKLEKIFSSLSLEEKSTIISQSIIPYNSTSYKKNDQLTCFIKKVVLGYLFNAIITEEIIDWDIEYIKKIHENMPSTILPFNLYWKEIFRIRNRKELLKKG